MNLLRDAAAAVQRNWISLLLYVGASTAANLAKVLADYAVLGSDPEPPISRALQIYGLGTHLVLVAVLAAIQAIAFARIGRDMDRPLWRTNGDWDALRRFYQLWLSLHLLSVLANQMLTASVTTGMEWLAHAGMWLFLLLVLLGVPIGTCIMFGGKFQWSRLGEHLAPLGRHFPRFLLLVLINFLQFLVILFFVEFRGEDPPLWRLLSQQTVAEVVTRYLDLLVFAGTWILCMLDRDADEDADLDF